MAKAKKGSKENPVTLAALSAVAEGKQPRTYSIIDAAIKDGFCNYTYEVTEGVGISDTHVVKGKGIILDDMPNAFQKLNVHLAALLDGFKRASVEIDNIDNFHNHEHASHYRVQGFKIKGGKDNESISLVGSMYVYTAGGWVSVTTPFIALDNLSSYTWYNELKAASDQCREEVALYKEGKCKVVEEDEDEEKGGKRKVRQLTIGSKEAIAEMAEESTEEDSFDDFSAVKE